MKKIFNMYVAGVLLSSLCAQINAGDCTPTNAQLDQAFGTDGALLIPGIPGGYINAGVYHAPTGSILGVGYSSNSSSALFVTARAVTGFPRSFVELELQDIILNALVSVTKETLITGGDNFTVATLAPDGNLSTIAPVAFADGTVNALLVLPGDRIMAAGNDSSGALAAALYPTDLSSITSQTTVMVGNNGSLYALALANDGTIIGAGVAQVGNNSVAPFVRYDNSGNVLTAVSYAPTDFAPGATQAIVFSAEPFDAENILTVASVNIGGVFMPVVAKVSNDLQTLETVTVLNQLPTSGQAPIQMQKDSEGYFVLQIYLVNGQIALTRLTPQGAFDYHFAPNCIATQVFENSIGNVVDYLNKALVASRPGALYSLGVSRAQQNDGPAIVKVLTSHVPPTPPYTIPDAQLAEWFGDNGVKTLPGINKGDIRAALCNKKTGEIVGVGSATDPFDGGMLASVNAKTGSPANAYDLELVETNLFAVNRGYLIPGEAFDYYAGGDNDFTVARISDGGEFLGKAPIAFVGGVVNAFTSYDPN